MFLENLIQRGEHSLTTGHQSLQVALLPACEVVRPKVAGDII
jgi:hypothetical protein